MWTHLRAVSFTLAILGCSISSVSAQVCFPGDLIVGNDAQGHLVRVLPGGAQQILKSSTGASRIESAGGSIYVSDNNGDTQIYRFDCATGATTVLDDAAGGSEIAVDPARAALYVVVSSAVYRLSLPNGGDLTQILDSSQIPQLASFDGTDYAAVDENGCLVITLSVPEHEVYRLPVPGICNTPGNAAVQLASSPILSSPAGIDVNRSSGTVYAADRSNHAVVQITSGGSVSNLTAPSSTAFEALAVSQNTGDIYASGSPLGTVYKISPISGNVSTAASGGSLGNAASVTVVAAANVCGNNVLEAGEDCDDGNTDDGDCCAATCTYEPIDSSCDDGNQCNGLELCDGEGSCASADPLICDDGDPCTSDDCDEFEGCIHGLADNGTACTDGDLCTLTDQCLDGACIGSDSPTCNDGNPCTADSCDPSIGCTATPGPIAEGLGIGSGKAAVTLKANINPAKRSLSLTLKKGAAVGSGQLGDPVDGNTSYGICMWDYVGDNPTPFYSAVIQPGGTCNGKPCWKTDGKLPDIKGYSYTNSKITGPGLSVSKLQVKAGVDGKSQVKLNAEGASLSMPNDPPPGRTISQDSKVTVQVENSSGTVWQTHFMQPWARNTATIWSDTE